MLQVKHRDAIWTSSSQIFTGFDSFSGVGLSKRGVGAVERVVNLHAFVNFPTLLVLLKFFHIRILFTKVVSDRGELIYDFAVKVYRLIR